MSNSTSWSTPPELTPFRQDAYSICIGLSTRLRFIAILQLNIYIWWHFHYTTDLNSAVGYSQKLHSPP